MMDSTPIHHDAVPTPYSQAPALGCPGCLDNPRTADARHESCQIVPGLAVQVAWPKRPRVNGIVK